MLLESRETTLTDPRNMDAIALIRKSQEIGPEKPS